MQEELYNKIMYDIQKRLEIGLAGHVALLTKSNKDILFMLKDLSKRKRRRLLEKTFKYYQYWFKEAKYDRMTMELAKDLKMDETLFKDLKEMYDTDIQMIALCLNVFDALKNLGAVVPQLRASIDMEGEEAELVAFSPEAALSVIRKTKKEESKLAGRGEDSPDVLADRLSPYREFREEDEGVRA